MIKVTFFGVRGSAPCAGPDFVRYGGHTSCVVVECDDHLVIFDAGSGIPDADPLALQNPSKKLFLFFSHVHLDHIMGLPFFAPVWQKDYTIQIMAGSVEPFGGIEKVLNQTFSPPLFPVKFCDFPASISCHDFKAGTSLEISTDLTIQTCALNHPDGGIGYRLTYQNHSICYITDTEHSPQPDSSILELAQDCDLFIYDSSYTDETYPSHKGWGHSTWQEGVRLAKKANAQKLAIFHHDPSHTDDKMETIEKLAKAEWSGAWVAKQGSSLVI